MTNQKPDKPEVCRVLKCKINEPHYHTMSGETLYDTQSAPDKCRVQGCTKKHLLEPITECLVCGAIDKTCFHPLQSTPDKTSMEKWDSDFTKRVAKQLREDGVPKVEGMKIITTPVDKSLRDEIEQHILEAYTAMGGELNDDFRKAAKGRTQSILQALSNRLPETCDDKCGLTIWSCNRLQDLVYTKETLDRRNMAVEIRHDMRDFYSEVRAIIEDKHGD